MELQHHLTRPKRPRTAYNYFFHDERMKLLHVHGRVGFQAMAKSISAKWKAITPNEMAHFANMANQDKLRYHKEMKEYKDLQKQLHKQRQGLASDDLINQGIPHSWRVDSVAFPEPSSRVSSIAQLAHKLDKESIDFLIALFK